ncbi:putative reverse transcriptase domain-containing protein [Tanacetum coccineum]
MNLNGGVHRPVVLISLWEQEEAALSLMIYCAFHTLNIIFSLLDDRDLHCCDSWWRSVLFSHLTGLIEEDVFSWLDEVSLVDGVFDGAFGGVRDEEVVIREDVVRFSSSFMRSTKSCFRGLMDPGGFIIPCIIGQSGITKALANLGASISLMPYSMFLRVNLGDLKPTRMCIELANKTTQFPNGIAENVVVKIDKFVFPVDFVILDMEEDHRIPIILGRPFFATAHAMIDVYNKKISFEVGDEIITFDLEKSMRFPPSNEDTCHSANIIDLSVLDNIKEILPPNHVNSIEPILDHLPAIHEDCNNPALFAANSNDKEKPSPKLKELPSHLEYDFLHDNHELPFIISLLLSEQEKKVTIRSPYQT